MGMEVGLNFVGSVAGVREVSQELSVVSGGKKARVSMPMVPCRRTSAPMYTQSNILFVGTRAQIAFMYKNSQDVLAHCVLLLIGLCHSRQIRGAHSDDSYIR
jgi:hypothetical protein